MPVGKYLCEVLESAHSFCLFLPLLLFYYKTTTLYFSTTPAQFTSKLCGLCQFKVYNRRHPGLASICKVIFLFADTGNTRKTASDTKTITQTTKYLFIRNKYQMFIYLLHVISAMITNQLFLL